MGKLLAFTQPKWPNQLVVRIFGGQSTIRPLCYSLGQNLIRMAFTILTLKMVLATTSAFNETSFFIRFVWTIIKTITNLVQGYTFTVIMTCFKIRIKLIRNVNLLFWVIVGLQLNWFSSSHGFVGFWENVKSRIEMIVANWKIIFWDLVSTSLLV